jgi:hypothetical protein
LSSMGGLFSVWGGELTSNYQFRRQTGTPTGRVNSAQSGGLSRFKRSGVFLGDFVRLQRCL